MEIEEERSTLRYKDIILERISEPKDIIEHLFGYLEFFSNINDLIYDQLLSQKALLSFILNYTDKLISTYLLEKLENEGYKLNIINNKRRIRNINYIIKSFKYKNCKYKESKESFKKIIDKYFIIFNYNLLKYTLIAKNKYSYDKRNKYIEQIYYLLKAVLYCLGISYFSKTINEDILASIIKLTLSFTLSKRLDKCPNKKEEEIFNMMFLSGCIELVKIIFKKLYKIQNNYTKKQEELFNSIILYINEEILGSNNERNSINYINKVFLSNNDYKTTSLIEFSSIIPNIKSKDVKNNFFDLLTNIYSFSFKYNNGMTPTLQQLEPLFTNIDRKNLEQIKNDIKNSDFTLNFIDELIQKEKKILRNNSCLLREGFYLGSKTSGIIFDFNCLDNDFMIMFGCKIEPNSKENLTLFDIINTKTKSSLIKFYLLKTQSINSYELFGQDSKTEISTRINVQIGKTYIFTFNFKAAKGFFQSRSIIIKYIRDEDNLKDMDNIKVNSGKILEIKNFKTDSLCFFFGCELIKYNIEMLKVENNFKGFIGDIIFLNMKNIKEKGENELEKILLGLKGNYHKIISIFTEKIKEFAFSYKSKATNIKLDRIKEMLLIYDDNENKLFNSIKFIINPKYFSIIDYRDDIDYLNMYNNYEYYLHYKDKMFQIKKKYLDIKNDPLEEDTIIKISNSVFDKKFHIFENELTLNRFIYYQGIHYLCLLFEYYYQVLCRLNSENQNTNINDIQLIFVDINQKILSVLNFFIEHIIHDKESLRSNRQEIYQFFYELSITLSKLAEKSIINIQTIKLLIVMLNTFNQYINKLFEPIEKMGIFLNIRKNLFDFLLNPKLYQEKDDSCLEKLYISITNLVEIVNVNPEDFKNFYIEELIDMEILDKILNFIWVLDNKSYKNQFYEAVKKKYIVFLTEFLKLSFQKDKNIIKEMPKTIDSEKEDKITDNDWLILNESLISISEKKENEQENEKTLINYYIEKAMKQKNNYFIFSKMCQILLKTNLIKQLDETKIKKLKYIIINQLEENYEKNNEKNSEKNKFIILSCIEILIGFYFSVPKKNKNNLIINDTLKKNNYEFNNFIKSLNLNLDLFYALIHSIKTIHYIFNNSEDNYYKEEEEEKSQINSINLGDEPIIEKEKKVNLFSGVPFVELNISKLNEIHSFIIKTIFEDIIYLLYKYVKNSHDINIINEILDKLKKNIDYIFKYPGTELYNTIFSSENEICAELFYLNMKLKENKGYSYIEKVITKYHAYLLKNHYSPFIYKFLLFFTNENILPFESNNNDTSAIQLKINLMIFIIENFLKTYKELKEINNRIFINNLLNFIIVINQEIDYNNKNDLFRNIDLCESLYKFILLIEHTGLLYSNYYIEINDNYGKIISEILYDLFFSFSEITFNEKYFLKIFTKENASQSEIFTVFYLIDLLKEDILEKEKRVKEKLNKFIPQLKNLRYFHKHYFSSNKKNSLKLFLNKKLFPIKDVNFSIYFLAKSFIYSTSDIMKNSTTKFKNFLMDKFLPFLSNNILLLYTKRNNFYGNKRCKKFPLYTYTKNYFESYMLQNNSFDLLRNFFSADMKVNLKAEYNINYCYSSRLIHDIKKIILPNKIMFSRNQSEVNMNISHKLTQDLSISLSMSTISINEGNLPILPSKAIYNSSLKDLCDKNLSDKNSDNISDDEEINLMRESEEIEHFNNFELIVKNRIISKPRKIFFKIKFSEIFKNFIFKDKIFQKIRLAYLIDRRNRKSVNVETKQMNYPTKQKNFSNFLEPRLFLKRDFNFYDKEFFPISNQYIERNVLDENIENLFLYKHEYKYKKENIKVLECELVTSQFLYFGKIYFLENCILFESSEDPRDNDKNENNYDIFAKYALSSKNTDNKSKKHKSVLIFNDEIKEIIKRRTLLTNQSLEIFLTNGKSYFYNFFRTPEAQKAYQYFNEINENLLKKNMTQFIFKRNNEDDVKDILSLFRKGKMTNYEYLLYLNKYSTRTYNDLSQYPIFPWLVLKHDEMEQILESLDNNIKIENESCLRDLTYPISLQTEGKREEAINKYIGEYDESNFPFHLYKHYSTTGYIYYFLIRMNPYGQNTVRFQNYKIESADRILNSYNEIEEILKQDSDNRELIPDFFCYFDFLCNLNCFNLGIKENGEMIDDLQIQDIFKSKYINKASSYVYSLYKVKKLLNSTFICKEIYKWVDIIFGKKQLPDQHEEAEKSCNIYGKITYEQKTNFEKKLEKYQKLIEEKKADLKTSITKIKNKIGISMNFGMTPKQILKESNIYTGENKVINSIYKVHYSISEKFLFFKNFSKSNFLLLKNFKKKGKNKTRIALICDKNTLKAKENNIYECQTFNLINKNKMHKTNIGERSIKIPLYYPEYAISFMFYQNEKNNRAYIPIILTCRYFGNYFKLQTNNKTLNIFCEDFVTCIRGRNTIRGDLVFYTGLLNGKLIEWQVACYLKIKENKSIYSHKSSITAIEINDKQKIIITASEDKFVHIRKIIDFELLTVIDLTNSFGNPIISKSPNIFPSLIKVSDLNLLYILFYDFDLEINVIRGYNLNGIFFAQTDYNNFKDENNNNLFINNISFTKNYDLVIGFFNANKYGILQSWGLSLLCPLKDIQDHGIPHYGTKIIEYDNTIGLFYLLYDNQFIIMNPRDKNDFKYLGFS